MRPPVTDRPPPRPTRSPPASAALGVAAASSASVTSSTPSSASASASSCATRHRRRQLRHVGRSRVGDPSAATSHDSVGASASQPDLGRTIDSRVLVRPRSPSVVISSSSSSSRRRRSRPACQPRAVDGSTPASGASSSYSPSASNSLRSNETTSSSSSTSPAASSSWSCVYGASSASRLVGPSGRLERSRPRLSHPDRDDPGARTHGRRSTAPPRQPRPGRGPGARR